MHHEHDRQRIPFRNDELQGSQDRKGSPAAYYKAKNVHLYFTDNSYNLGDKEIYFTSTRPYEHQNISNLFKMDLTTGIMTQMTDEAEGVGSCTKSPDGELLVYTLNRKQIVKVNTRTGARDVIYEEKDNYQIGHPLSAM